MPELVKNLEREWQKMHSLFCVEKSYSNHEKRVQKGYPGRGVWLLFEGQPSL